MECNLPGFLRLPREIRDEIYRYVVLEEEEVHMYPPREPLLKNREHRTWTVLLPRYQARIIPTGLNDGSILLSTTASLGQINRQIRSDISDLLDDSQLPMVTRVQNFDFDHITRYLTALSSQSRLQRHVVREDGIIPRKLLIELSGPYDGHWEDNLLRWAECLEKLLPEEDAEFGGLHKLAAVAGWSRLSFSQGDMDIMRGEQLMWRRRPRGAGRLALEKIFWMLYERWRLCAPFAWASEIDQAAVHSHVKRGFAGCVGESRLKSEAGSRIESSGI